MNRRARKWLRKEFKATFPKDYKEESSQDYSLSEINNVSLFKEPTSVGIIVSDPGRVSSGPFSGLPARANWSARMSSVFGIRKPADAIVSTMGTKTRSLVPTTTEVLDDCNQRFGTVVETTVILPLGREETRTGELMTY